MVAVLSAQKKKGFPGHLINLLDCYVKILIQSCIKYALHCPTVLLQMTFCSHAWVVKGRKQGGHGFFSHLIQINVKETGMEGKELWKDSIMKLLCYFFT